MSKRRTPPLSMAAMAGAAAILAVAVLLGWRASAPTPAGDRSGIIPPSGRPSEAAADDDIATRLVHLPCKVGAGVYLLGNLFPAAVYVVETADGLAMIDSGLEAEYDKVIDALRFLRLDVARLKMILLTHAHGDHTMGAERLRRETGARLYIGQPDAQVLRQGGPWEAIFSKFDMPGVETHPTMIEEEGELVDGQTLTLGEARFSAIAAPGHTPGSFCFLLELAGQRVLFTGDAVMSLSDGLGTYSAYLPPKYRGDVGQYLLTLRKLRELAVPDLLLPGHPTSDPVPQDPRLTQRQWHALLDRGIAELEQLAERYAKDGFDFLDGKPKELAADLFYLGDLEGQAVYALLSAGQALLFDAARGERPAEFLDAAWNKLGIPAPPIASVLLTSCQAPNVAGLRPLVEATGCRVAASLSGVERAKENCPPQTELITSDELATLGYAGLAALSVPGIDETATAYLFDSGESRVLVSGQMPLEGGEAELPWLFQQLSSSDSDTDEFSASLRTLSKVRPDLWLSARPLYGRNANLYDDDWARAMALNQNLLRRCTARGPR